MPRKKDNKPDKRPDFESDEDKRFVTRLGRAIRRYGPGPVRRRFTSKAFIERYCDRKWHGGVAKHERNGYALRQPEMVGLAPGLLKANHAFLTPADLPTSAYDFSLFNQRLVVARASRNETLTCDVKTVFEVACKNWDGRKGLAALNAHSEAMWAINQNDPSIFAAAALGDFPACRRLLQEKPAEAQLALIRILARQRIVWSLFDQHRVGAHSYRAVHHLLPSFLRPFVKNETANAQINAMLAPARAIDILYDKSENAEGLGLDKIRTHGPRQVVIERLANRDDSATASIEDLATQLRNERPHIRLEIGKLVNELEAVLHDPDRSDQQTLYEWHFVLCPIAASYAIAYRVAEDEAVMMRVIDNPSNHQALFDVNRRPFPRERVDAVHSRAIRLLAAYRAVFLGGPSYKPEDVDDTKVAQAAGEVFWARMSMANDPDPKELRAAKLLDLSHWAREGRSGG